MLFLHISQGAQSDADVGADAALDADALAGALPEGGNAGVLREGLAVASGGWPLPR
jgi:hypothetical protein